MIQPKTFGIVFVLGLAMSGIIHRGFCQGISTQRTEKSPLVQAQGSFVIRHARIFDGIRVIPADSVLVQQGRIRFIGKNLKVPSDVPEIDASGDTLLPGLIDSHTHDWGESPKQALLFGVTTELNMGGMPNYSSDLKQQQSQGNRLDWSDVLSAGNVVTPPGGHGTEYGVTVPTLTNAAETQQFVDERIAEGSDYIKIILEDGHACHFQFLKLSPEELAASITAAHKRGRLAIVHISSQADARAAIAAGADGIAHIFSDSMPKPDFAQFLHAHHAFVITTLTAAETSHGTPNGVALAADRRLAPFLSADAQQHLKSPMPAVCQGRLEYGLAAVKQLFDAGVPILAGTDAPAPGNWNGVSMHGELELLVRAGLTPLQALIAGTSLPAKVFQLSDRGFIAKGLRADLLLVRGDPTHDITATRDIVAVWKWGVRDDREAIRQKLD